MPDLLTRDLHDDLLGALLAGDSVRARHLVDRAVVEGMLVGDVYLDVLAPALHAVGRRWEEGEIGIAWEHRATAIAESILGALGPRMRVPPTTGRLAVAACTPGERHELGCRMVADFLEGAGWEVIRLGASLPVPALVDLVEDEAPDVVALSTATADRLADATEAVRAVTALRPRPWVVVGGRGWEAAPEGAPQRAGADISFADPRALADDLRDRFPAVEEDVL